MSKEWICADCVKYKTDACSTCACGYTPTVSCRDVLVDYDYAYQQGRADAEAEIKPLLKAIRFVLEDYSIRLGDYAKVIDEKLKENRND